VHDYDKKFGYELVNLEKAELLLSNKGHILAYKDFQLSESITVARVQRAMSLLRQMAFWLKKDFKQATEDDLRKLVTFFQSKKCEHRDRGYSESTKQTYRATLKAFYKFLEGKNQDYPEKIRWLKVAGKNKDRKLPEDLLSEKEIRSLIEHAPDLQTKALIALLGEGGLRIGEALLLSNKNVEFDDYGCKVIIQHSKTRPRKVRLVKAAPYLFSWKNAKPFKNPEEPFWVFEKSNTPRRLPYCTAAKRIKLSAKKAGISKRIHAHLFRHSVATILSEKLSEAQMKEYLGWEQDSKMASVYIHLSGKRVDNAILEMNGLKKKEIAEERSELIPTKCPRCETFNEATNEYCKHCWLPLTLEANNEIQQNSEKTQESLVSLMKLIELAGANPEKIKQTIASLQQEAAKGV